MYKELINVLEPIMAENDCLFQKHFLETKYVHKLLSLESDVIYGPKGSGKTALSLALTSIHKAKYFDTNTLNLENLSFNRLLDNFKALEGVLNESVHKISRIAWMNTLLNFAIFTLKEKIDDSALKNKINMILKVDGFISGDPEVLINSDEKINNFLERILNRITELPFNNKKIFGSVSTEQSNVINQFPLNKTTSEILDKLINIVNQSGKKILISIDGLDSIMEHKHEAREVIFTGLIDAVYNIRINRKISSAFIFKAFLPQEFTLDANIKIWDADKHTHHVHFIRWDSEELKLFLIKRFKSITKINSNKFEDYWNEFFPEKITNPVYGVEENTFNYILRHTLYRPRQVQDQIYFIIDKWIERTGGGSIIQANFIPGAVSRNNLVLAENVANQLSRVHSSIITFLKSWEKSTSNLTVKMFRERISKLFIPNDGIMDYQVVNRLFDDLYTFGIFGIAIDNNEKDFKSKSKDFHFSFVNEFNISSIHSTTNDDDIIAFSPMFREYCGIKRNNDYIIRPVKKDSFL